MGIRILGVKALKSSSRSQEWRGPGQDIDAFLGPYPSDFGAEASGPGPRMPFLHRAAGRDPGCPITEQLWPQRGAQARNKIGRKRSWRRSTCVALAMALVAGAADATETIAFLRHGEKPPAGLGQIDCQGLNRALKLPGALAALFPAPAFPRPAAIFVPDPSVREEDHGVLYDYVRPLETIAPTAVALEHADQRAVRLRRREGADQGAGKGRLPGRARPRRLGAPDGGQGRPQARSRIMAATRMRSRNGSGTTSTASMWSPSIGTGNSATFEKKAEGLNGQPEACPR